MGNDRIVFPFIDKLLLNLNQAILFISEEGMILKGNKRAWILLNIQHPGQVSINDYLNLDGVKNLTDFHSLVELKQDEERLVEIKAISVKENLYCLIMNEVVLQDKKEEVKKYINRVMKNDLEGMFMYDKQRILDCDATFATMFGYSLKEIKNKKVNELFDQKNMNKLMNTEESYVINGIKVDGTTVYLQITEHPYETQGNIVHVAIIRDITEKVQYEKRMEYMAYYDEITDLPNQNFFVKVLNEAIKKSKENVELLAVYYIDLNHFKEINDTFGYTFGNKLLKACGDKFKAFLDTDTFLARNGGDEFTILQRNMPDRSATVQLAESLIQAFEKPIRIEEYDIYVSVSIGISIYPDHGKTASDVMKHADAAMYVIKKEQRNNYKIFEPSISEDFKKMLLMENDLRKALIEGQFELHYQPQKNIETDKIVGIEALLRWKHPTKGYIPPLDFIPIAEKSGLIIDIGDWVIREACQQNKNWQDKGYEPIAVSVNLSIKQLLQNDLVERIECILESTGLLPHHLELEITESMAMTNEEYVISTLNRLRKLGVLVSIDDFGTGYSSLKYLSLFPVTKLKIDKMFMDANPNHNKAIVKSIILMSHSLNMKVIAEGVENVEQLMFLKEEKCDEIQGYYFSKPLPPKEITKLLNAS